MMAYSLSGLDPTVCYRLEASEDVLATKFNPDLLLQVLETLNLIKEDEKKELVCNDDYHN